MTDQYTYDDSDDAAECILGAAEDLAAVEAADDEIPVDPQEIRGDDDDDASVYSTETKASDPTMALFSDMYNDINPLDGTGLLCGKCGGTFVKYTSKSTKQKRNAVLRQWSAFVAGAHELPSLVLNLWMSQRRSRF